MRNPKFIVSCTAVMVLLFAVGGCVSKAEHEETTSQLEEAQAELAQATEALAEADAKLKQAGAELAKEKEAMQKQLDVIKAEQKRLQDLLGKTAEARDAAATEAKLAKQLIEKLKASGLQEQKTSEQLRQELTGLKATIAELQNKIQQLQVQAIETTEPVEPKETTPEEPAE